MNVTVTGEAEKIVKRVREDGRENLIMVLGTGCCDSTSPFLYDNYLPEPDSQSVGMIDGVQIMAPKWLADLYPGDEGLIVDVDPGVVNDSFSLESEYDCRFTLRLPERPAQR
jgi:uncharacterized protein (DUF779 family)